MPKPRLKTETIDGVVHLSTLYRGVEYIARADGEGWEVQSHRLALGADHVGMIRRFASTQALATGLRAFASLLDPVAPASGPVAASASDQARQVVRKLKATRQALGAAPTLQAFARKKVGPALLEQVYAAQALDIPDNRPDEKKACQEAITDAMALIGRWQLVRLLLPPGSVRV